MLITRLETVSFTFRYRVKRDRNAGGIAAESERKILVGSTESDMAFQAVLDRQLDCIAGF